MSNLPGKSNYLFLLTNDDGYLSQGITTLADKLKSLGEVVIIAPNSEKSASGHSVTFFNNIDVEEIETKNHYPIYAVDGTPVDCVKLGLRTILDREPDIVVSGVNNGENTGHDIHYSGTVSAAMEGAIYGIPSIAVSVPYSSDPRYDTASEVGLRVINDMMIHNIYNGVVLNLNVPNLSLDKLAGLSITRQSDMMREDFYEVVEKNGRNTTYQIYRHTDGYYPEGVEVDRDAILSNFASLTPIYFNRTHRETIPILKGWDTDLTI